jgi:protochlorophyllide reductase
MEQLQKPTVIVTGASSGVGLYTTKSLIDRGLHVVMACRDVKKAGEAAQEMGLPQGSFSIMHLNLGDLESVRRFAREFQASDRPFKALLCNAAIYMPLIKEPLWSPEGYELTMTTNQLPIIRMNRAGKYTLALIWESWKALRQVSKNQSQWPMARSLSL